MDWNAFETRLLQLHVATGTSVAAVGVSTLNERRIYAGWDNAELGEPKVQRYPLGCVSRPLIAALVTRLAEQQKLNLERPASTYLQEFRDEDRFSRITLRHLLNQTAGYQAIGSLEDVGSGACTIMDLRKKLQGVSQVFIPGTVVSFDQSSTMLLAEIAGRVAEVSIVAQLEELIACIDETTRVQSPASVVHLLWRNLACADEPGAGGRAPSFMSVTASASELLGISEAMCGREAFKRAGLDLSALYADEVLQPIPAGALTSGTYSRIGYGFGVAQYDGGLFGIDARSDITATSLRFLPETGLCLALVLENKHPYYRDHILRTLLQTLDVKETCAAKRDMIDVSPNELVGQYSGMESADLEVRVAGREIIISLEMEGAEVLEFYCQLDKQGHLVCRSSANLLAPAVFRDPVSLVPCLMLGGRAFKRVGACRG